MAYPTVSAPYGLVPVNLLGGRVYAGAVRHIPIATGYADDIFNGDVVKLATDGTIERDTGTTTATPIGVFVGCAYTNSDGEFVNRNYWPTGTVSADAVAYVVDDPDVLMKVALVSGTTVVAPYTRTEIVGANVAIVANEGSTANGRSKIAVDGTSAAATLTLPLRVIDVVEETKDSNGEYVECIVKWNEPYPVLSEGTPNTVVLTGGHLYRNNTGTA